MHFFFVSPRGFVPLGGIRLWRKPCALVLPRGLEPRLQDPESCVLSIELWKHLTGTIVPGVGIEPTCLTAHRFKRCVYTNFTTQAYKLLMRCRRELHPRMSVLQTEALLLRHGTVYKVRLTVCSLTNSSVSPTEISPVKDDVSIRSPASSPCMSLSLSSLLC